MLLAEGKAIILVGNKYLAMQKEPRKSGRDDTKAFAKTVVFKVQRERMHSS